MTDSNKVEEMLTIIRSAETVENNLAAYERRFGEDDPETRAALDILRSALLELPKLKAERDELRQELKDEQKRRAAIAESLQAHQAKLDALAKDAERVK